jgi:hypothetical protein
MRVSRRDVRLSCLVRLRLSDEIEVVLSDEIGVVLSDEIEAINTRGADRWYVVKDGRCDR